MLVPDGYCEDKECPNIACKDCLREQFKIKAIEQLEKVKTKCEFSISFACDEQEQRLYEFIDQQIKELKGE